MRDLLLWTAAEAIDYIESAEAREHVSPARRTVALDHLKGPLPSRGATDRDILADLCREARAGLIPSTGSQYFGFVVGGVTPIALAADWLTSVWDQNAQVYATSPAASVVEEVVAKWLIELLGFPTGSSVGFTTGCQMATFTALSAARNRLLTDSGWDFDSKGLFGAPKLQVFMSDASHSTIRNALRMVGFGTDQITDVISDDQGRMRLQEIERHLKNCESPAIITLQAGNVNTGSFESIAAVAALAQERTQQTWIHVDGAFGLWAAASPRFSHLFDGLQSADSWCVDAHKWLNVPYDSGMVIMKNPEAHRAVKLERCAYAGLATSERRDGSSWAPENSRRARGFVLYAALRSLGREGMQELVECSCDMASLFAALVDSLPYASVVNEVILNQVLIRFDDSGHVDSDSFHELVGAEIQLDGRCWIGSTIWKGQTILRVSVCNWQTNTKSIEDAFQILQRAYRTVLTNN